VFDSRGAAIMPSLFACRGFSRDEYFAIESDNVKDFNEIIVSKKMVVHHVPSEVLKAMKKVVSAV